MNYLLISVVVLSMAVPLILWRSVKASDQGTNPFLVAAAPAAPIAFVLVYLAYSLRYLDLVACAIVFVVFSLATVSIIKDRVNRNSGPSVSLIAKSFVIGAVWGGITIGLTVLTGN